MARGRKSDTAAVKYAKGNPSRRPIHDDPDHLEDIPADASKWIITRAAGHIYCKIAAALKELHFIKSTDEVALARYCEDLHMWFVATREINKNGMTIMSKSRHGELLRRNPAFDIRDKLARRLERAEDQFGMNPSSRYALLAHLAIKPVQPTASDQSDTSSNQPTAGLFRDMPATRPN